jgi:hypothetical protein
VFTTQGEFDPWMAYGITEDINESSPTFVIPGDFGSFLDFLFPNEHSTMQVEATARIWVQ